MKSSQDNEQLDSLIREVLKNASLPYSPESWDEMERLLEKDPGKYGSSLSDYSQYLVVGGLGLLVIGGMLFMVFKSNSPEPDNREEAGIQSIVSDTSGLTAAPASADSIQQLQDSTAIKASADSTKAAAEAVPKQEESDRAEKKKKRPKKDSLSIASSTKESIIDTGVTQKLKKKKKKKSGDGPDSLTRPSTPAEDNSVPVEETEKSARDTSR